MNTYCCKAFRGSKLQFIQYVQAISSQQALIEFKNYLDQEKQLHCYFTVKQIDQEDIADDNY